MKKQQSPAVIVLMVAGIIVAIGFVFTQLTGNTPGPVKNLPPDTTTKTSAPATTQVASNSGQPGQPAGDAASGAVASEAILAPTADPFRADTKTAQPIVVNPQPTAAANTRVATTSDNTKHSLPPITASPMGPAPIVNLPSTLVKEPELAGTLLGERPSAVFRNDKRLAIVPVGGQFQDWKVVSVQHGAVTLKGFGRTLQLGVGGLQPRTAGMRTEEAPRNPHASLAGHGDYVEAADPFRTPDKVASYVQTPATGQPVPVTSEPNSITHDLNGDTSGAAAPAGAAPQSPPAGQGDPAGQNTIPQTETPATMPPVTNGNKTTPPADPPANTEKVIDQAKDKPKDPPTRP